MCPYLPCLIWQVCGPFELSNVPMVEGFCRAVLARFPATSTTLLCTTMYYYTLLCTTTMYYQARFPRIHALINNAAQTLTRAAGWEARLVLCSL